MTKDTATPAFAKASAGKQKKIDTVSSLTEKLSRAKSVVIADYSGIKHKQLEDLRKNVKKAEGEFAVIKNKLFERALGGQAETVKPMLKNASAALFAYGDEVEPLKALVKFFKTVNLGKTKGGLLGTAVLSDSEVERLSTLPGRQVLLGQLAGQLNAPIQGLHYALNWNIMKLIYALNAVKEKKN
jgi:large subunit ribosomal protein L10